MNCTEFYIEHYTLKIIKQNTRYYIAQYYKIWRRGDKFVNLNKHK